ncbi:MAG: flavodoxin family protein [Lachnospiraceae bacterium]|nr:flavodoxin family protein [Lachnospiraceae bacterium]
MNIEVRYYTKTGNTKKLADAIAEEVGVEAKPISVPITEETDILFLGSSVYAAEIDPQVKKFIARLDGKVKMVVSFSTAAIYQCAFRQVKKHVNAKGIKVADEEFHCSGQFNLMHKGKPDNKDIANVKEFARKIIEK